jgi:enamine deaminase RidA (YjgF/YER057c/UK114 family)
MTVARSDPKAPVAIFPEGVPSPKMPYSPAVKAGDWVFFAGQLATDFKTGVAAEARASNPFLGDKLELESRYVMRNLAATVTAAGCDIGTDAIRMWQWFVSDRPTPEEFAQGNTWTGLSIEAYTNVRNEFVFEPRPASTGMGVRELAVRGTSIEVDLICAADGGVSVGTTSPEGLPKPLAGYSPALRRGDWIFLAGELPTDWIGDYNNPDFSGDPSALAKEARLNPFFWYGSSIEKQTDYTLKKLSAIAEAAGTSFDRAVKAEVYIAHPNDFAGMERVWKRWFPKDPPARVVIPYMGLAGKGSKIEIALTLLANDAKIKKETIETSAAPPPLGHEPQAIRAGNFVFLSQQMAFGPDGRLASGMERDPAFPWYGSPGRAQMRYMLNNVAAICEASGTTLSNVVRRACFHDDTQWFAESIDEWVAHFPGVKPASTTIKIGGPLLVPGANTLLDLIAYAPAR